MGFLLGIAISLGLRLSLGDVIGIPPVITGSIMLYTAILSLIMGIIASLAPLRRLLTIDPAEVFKS